MCGEVCLCSQAPLCTGAVANSLGSSSVDRLLRSPASPTAFSFPPARDLFLFFRRRLRPCVAASAVAPGAGAAAGAATEPAAVTLGRAVTAAFTAATGAAPDAAAAHAPAVPEGTEEVAVEPPEPEEEKKKAPRKKPVTSVTRYSPPHKHDGSEPPPEHNLSHAVADPRPARCFPLCGCPPLARRRSGRVPGRPRDSRLGQTCAW